MTLWMSFIYVCVASETITYLYIKFQPISSSILLPSCQKYCTYFSVLMYKSIYIYIYIYKCLRNKHENWIFFLTISDEIQGLPWWLRR